MRSHQSSGTEINRILIGLGVIVLIVALAVQLKRPVSQVQFIYAPGVFLLAIFASIPLSLVVASVIRILSGGERRFPFWVVHPAVETGRVAHDPLVQLRTEMIRRLKELSFELEEQVEPDRDVLVFRKRKAGWISGFLDNAFEGEIHMSGKDGATVITARLTLKDTVLIETGETARLRQVADFLILRSEDIKLPYVSNNMDTAFILANANLVLWTIRHFSHPELIDWSFTISLACGGLMVFALWPVMVNRTWEGRVELMLGTLMSAVPFLAVF